MINTVDKGSSPLARGLHNPLAIFKRGNRIIPARAGFTSTNYNPAGMPTDHPRSRGVYSLIAGGNTLPGGSSPLARGLQLVRVGGQIADRIIPARAGFTDSSRGIPGPLSDHPRSRGVYPPVHGRGPTAGGSSPLARGLRHKAFTDLGISRIIPARAGFTRQVEQNGHRLQDHPRSRGVYNWDPAPVVCENGSSPLARGLRAVAHDPDREVRIIPARAGFTRRPWGRT